MFQESMKISFCLNWLVLAIWGTCNKEYQLVQTAQALQSRLYKVFLNTKGFSQLTALPATWEFELENSDLEQVSLPLFLN